ncbi:MAG TPA: hypothetical protein VMF52_11895 [Steroidobacteraceae bacterium]|nr:hypothetical protein [Steroidobacteraceae bacterium]
MNTVTEFLAPDGYSLERQVAIARRRLADARAAAHRAFEEYRIYEARDSHVETIRLARARAETTAAQCRKLRAVLAKIEALRDCGCESPPVSIVRATA